jgi:hypothetical protein
MVSSNSNISNNDNSSSYGKNNISGNCGHKAVRQTPVAEATAAT